MLSLLEPFLSLNCIEKVNCSKSKVVEKEKKEKEKRNKFKGGGTPKLRQAL